MFKRFAVDRIAKLKANDPVGSGRYGSVFGGDTPGTVIKEIPTATSRGGMITYDTDTPKQRFANISDEVLKEANAQDVGYSLHMAPSVHSVDLSPEAGYITSQDLRPTHTSIEDYIKTNTGDGSGTLTFDKVKNARRIGKTIDLKTAQQVGALALKGKFLEDRHEGNILINKMTGRPSQIDFGIVHELDQSQQAAVLSMANASGFQSAGLEDIGIILRDTVMDLLEGGQVAEAFDVAKQGFSRLQKIKEPVYINGVQEIF